MDFSPKTNQTFHKQIAISFKEGNSFDYDRGYDSEIEQRQATDMYWKFPQDENLYGIAGIQSIKENMEVPLEIIIETSQKINLKIDELQNVHSAIFLKDTKTNRIYNLSESSAKIDIEPGIHSDRFYIAFGNETLSIKENLLGKSFEINHYRNLRQLSIKNIGNSVVNKISVYTILGQKVIELDDELKFKGKEVLIKTNKLSNSSIYIVSIETNDGGFSKKFY